MKKIRNLKDLSKILVKYTAYIVGSLCAIFGVLYCLCCVLEKNAAFLEKVMPSDLISFVRSVLMLLFRTESVFESFEILFIAIASLVEMVVLTSIYSATFIFVFFFPHHKVETGNVEKNVDHYLCDSKFFGQTKVFALNQQYRL